MVNANQEKHNPLSRPTAHIALVGVHGYGLIHLRFLRSQAALSNYELVAVADPQTPSGESRELVGDVPHYATLTELLVDHKPDVVILATPIYTHAALAAEAIRGGSHVLMEKPPTASLAEFADLLELSKQHAKACQVGFQSLGSTAFGTIDEIIAAGEIGEVRGIGVVGTWLRAEHYYARAAWAGKRFFHGRPVADGAITNPLSHSIATALRIDRSTRVDDVAELTVELFRAHPIEADDTSSVLIRTAKGTPIAAGLTLCSPVQTEPRVVVHGSEGTLTFYYKLDVIEVAGTGGSRRIECGTVSLLDNLVAHIQEPAVELVSSLEDAGAFMRVLEAVMTAPEPTPIPERHIEWREDEFGRHPVVADIQEWCERVAAEQATFTMLEAPFTRD